MVDARTIVNFVILFSLKMAIFSWIQPKIKVGNFGLIYNLGKFRFEGPTYRNLQNQNFANIRFGIIEFKKETFQPCN